MGLKNNIYLFRFLSIYTMGTIFLPIVSFNIPSPFGRTFFAGSLLIILFFIERPKLLISKYILIFPLFIFILYFGSITIWRGIKIGIEDQITLSWILTDIYGAFLSIIMYLYFIRSRDFKGLAQVVFSMLIMIVITSFTTIIGMQIFPNAVREMATPTSNVDNLWFMKIGIANYGFFGGIIFIFPIIAYYLKENSLKRIYIRAIILGILILFYALILAQFTTALVLSALIFLYAYFKPNLQNYAFLIMISIVFLSLFVFNDLIADIFYYIADHNELLQFKMNDIGKVFEFRDFNPSSQTSYFASSRLTLTQLSWNNFLENPFIGTRWGGGHSTWLDRLGMFGILGFFPWIIIFKQQIQLNLPMFDYKYKSNYLLSMLSCLMLGILTTTATSYQSMASIFFLVPGMFALKFLR